MVTHSISSQRSVANALDPSWRQATPLWWTQPPPLTSTQRPIVRTPWHSIWHPLWLSALQAIRRTQWPMALAVAVALVLLVAFYQVVTQVVAQANDRHAAVAALAELAWKCKTQTAADARAVCLTQISAGQSVSLR